MCVVFAAALRIRRNVSMLTRCTIICGFESWEALGQTCKILQGPETSAEALRDLHAARARDLDVKKLREATRGYERLREATRSHEGDKSDKG